MGGFISLEDAKAQLRVDHADEDVLIQSLIATAARQIEEATGFVAPAREQEAFQFDRFGRALRLKLRPVDLDSIQISYLDPNGDEQSFTDFRAYERNGYVRIEPAIGFCWPAAACVASAVTVTADVGFGDAAADCPAELQHASRLAVSAWYQDREGAAEPLAVAALLSDERPRRI
ncbi:MAG TPA: head-tail connector protein [Allosphingosinicella sp.]|jgi:uncharacterized phiE125 gp8 family phage protein